MIMRSWDANLREKGKGKKEIGLQEDQPLKQYLYRATWSQTQVGGCVCGLIEGPEMSHLIRLDFSSVILWGQDAKRVDAPFG